MTRYSLKFIGRLLLSTLLILPFYAESRPAAAQNSPSQDTAQPPPQDTPQQSPSQTKLAPRELDQLVAPIALYPDPLLAEVLMASAYPLDVVQAERWLESNKSLKGDQLKAAVDKQPWDNSIKALTATPSVIQMMSSKLDWTQKLGDAVVNQQPDVMDAVQRLRARAQSTDKLQTTRQQTVSVNQVEGRSVIAIEPAVPDQVYVPYYDPAVVYGDWPYPDYPPYYFEPPYYIGTGLLATGLAFGAGYAIGRWGGWWNGGVNWSGGGNNIVINRPGGRPTTPIAGVGNRWQPRVDHRQALGNRGERAQRDFRGTNGRQVLNPNNRAGSRNNVANRNNATHKAAAKNRATQGSRVSQGGAKNKAASNKGAAKSKVSQRAGGGKNATARNRTAARTANTSRGRQAATNMRGRSGTGGLGGYSRSAGMRARTGTVGMGGGGGLRAGGGGMRMGGGARGGGGRGGGRRSDIMLKHDIVLLSHLENGLNVYRFTYNGSTKPYVGVMAQEVQQDPA
jgi:hypothetical protein